MPPRKRPRRTLGSISYHSEIAQGVARGPPRASERSGDKVFVSYCEDSQNDKKYYLRLMTHLRRLESEGKVITWDVSNLRPGDNWQLEIEAEINAARVAILLLSADYFASDYLAEVQLPDLLEKAKKTTKIIPIMTDYVEYWRTDLAAFHPANPEKVPLSEMKRSRRERFFAELAGLIEDMLSESA